jgi:hypothetical protein
VYGQILIGIRTSNQELFQKFQTSNRSNNPENLIEKLEKITQ